MKVTLLGDSIRQQYGPKVKEILGDDFEVWAPEDNCRFAKYTLRGLFDWAANMEGSEIVHWNNGLWDLCDLFGDGTFTSEEEYVENILRIADILQKRYPVVIFATTTPVSANNVFNRNVDADRFNQRVVPLLKERGIIINDLNSLVGSDVENYICNDTIHLSEAAIEICAEQVAKYILDAAKTLDSAPNREAVNQNESSKNSMGAPVLL